jgi:hypothetical protein
MPRSSSRSRGDDGNSNTKSEGKGSRRWRSRSRTRSRSRGRKQKQQQQQIQQQQMQQQQLVNRSHDGTTSAGYPSSAGMLGEADEFAYVTSPARVSKPGLTGNISSLFRTAFKRGSSGDSQRQRQRQHTSASEDLQQHNQYRQQQQQQYYGQAAQAYPSSLGAVTSPENIAVYSRNDVGAASIASSGSGTKFAAAKSKKKHRFGSGGSNGSNKKGNPKNNSNSNINKHDGQSVASRNSSRLFYSNADDGSDSENSFDERSRSSRARATTPNIFTTDDYAENTNHSHGTSHYNDQSQTTDTSFFTDASASRSESTHPYQPKRSSSTSKKSKRHQNGKEYDDDDDDDVPSTTILRYRGFSTSIKNLFLDEGLVCASMGCFGLILSNRTEHLLQLRNDRRGVKWGRNSSRRTLPSRIVAYALLLTLILIGITFVIWGFGSDSNNSNPFAFNSYNNGGSSSSSNSNSGNYNYDDDGDGDGANQNQNQNSNYNDDGGNDDANYNADGNINDDAGNYNDDGGYNNDDANNNDDGADDWNYYNNGGRQLDPQITEDSLHSYKKRQQHRVNGIFKIRDMKESLWEPAIDFLSDEWYRPYQERHLEDYVDDNYNYNDDNSGTSGSSKRDMASDLRISLAFTFLIVLGILGRRRRMRTRYYLVRARAQEDHLFYASSGTGTKRVGFQDSREDQYEGACSHTLCGCYPTDPPREGDEIEDEVQVNDDGVSQRKKKPHNEDCIGRGFNCLLGFCCGFVCKCWFQCLSICALAQEAREMRLLVPTRFQRVDYITHQPFHEYQKEVNDLRRGWMGKTRKKSGIMPHFNALSRLSRYILVISVSLTSIIAATLFFNPRASFSWPDIIILSATFLQSFLVLWIVHWIFHKSDLSLDAVIKFFTAGFIIAVPSAFFFEGLLVNITLITAVLGYSLGQFMGGDTFVEWISQHYRLLWIVIEIFNAYIVATVTEELCKYYTFRCVEHPDLIFLTGLVSTTQDERALEGGVVKYPFSSHQVQRTNAKNPYDDDASHYSRSSHRSKGSGKNENLDPEEDESFEDDQDVRTHRQKAAAVTTAMISVAVGLACAENFLYVFLLGGTGAGSDSDGGESAMDGYLQEWIVLFFRSIFPVHALAAAMQSINMIRKFVEIEHVNGHRIGVGRIILPAVIMHGTFDAILLGINVFIETSWDDYMEANGGNIDEENPIPYNSFIVNLVAWLSITFVLLAGFIWYYKENRRQRLRLIQMEEHEKAMGSPGYTSPRVPRVSEVELV